MLHNTLTVAEWANLNEYCSTEWLQNNVLFKWLENYFSDEQKQKDAEAAAHFQTKAAKTAQVIISLRKFALENLISVISFLLESPDSTQHFYLLDHWFSGHRLSSPPPHTHLCQHTTFIYCAKYMNTYTGKSFCWHKGGVGNDMLENVAFQTKNLFHYHKIL